MVAIIKWIKHNLWYKLLALALSVALWAYVVNTYNPLATVDVRAAVGTRNVPEGLQQLAIVPSEVRVRLQGRAKVLEPLEHEQTRVRMVADLTGKAPGSHEIVLEPGDLPRGVTVVTSAPLKATVDLEEVKSENRQVVIQVVGVAAEGFQCRKEAPQPESVMIRGPGSVVASVRNVVARISVSELEATTDFRPPVHAVNVEGQRVAGVTVEPSSVDVRVIVEPVPHRAVVVQAVFRDPPPGRELERFSVRPTTVVVSGPKDLLDSLPSIKTAPISLDGVDRRATRSVSLRPPAGVSIPGPATATVTVLLKPFPRRATPPVDDGPEDDGDAADDGDEGEEAGEEGAAGEHPGGE